MRLIDAENFSKAMKDYFTDMITHHKYNVDCVDCNADLQRLLDNHPTTYDVDKVVEELNELDVKSITRYKNGNFGNFDGVEYYIKKRTAIEIVKQGVVSDDVCEWKSASDGEFILNPHTKRLFSNEPSMQNVYCNTCGKKIKIGGD